MQTDAAGNTTATLQGNGVAQGRSFTEDARAQEQTQQIPPGADDPPGGGDLVTYVWRDDTPQALIVHAGGNKRVLYLEVDHLGSPIAARNQAGRRVWRWESDAFGSTAPNDDPDGDGIKTTINLRFSGQYFDAESALHYNWARYYDPKLGRYISADPIGVEGGDNAFAYANVNPLSFVDPLGLVAEGHHWVIGPIRNDPNLSPAAAKVFRDAKTGYYGERHGWDKAHSEYNKGVQDLWNSKKLDPANMSKAQAQDFVRDVMRSSDPRVADYRRTIINRCLSYGMRRGSWSRGGQE